MTPEPSSENAEPEGSVPSELRGITLAQLEGIGDNIHALADKSGYLPNWYKRGSIRAVFVPGLEEDNYATPYLESGLSSQL